MSTDEPTREEIEAAARRHQWSLWRNSNQPDRFAVRPYLCACGRWHVGHERPRKRGKRQG